MNASNSPENRLLYPTLPWTLTDSRRSLPRARAAGGGGADSSLLEAKHHIYEPQTSGLRPGVISVYKSRPPYLITRTCECLDVWGGKKYEGVTRLKRACALRALRRLVLGRD